MNFGVSFFHSHTFSTSSIPETQNPLYWYFYLDCIKFIDLLRKWGHCWCFSVLEFSRVFPHISYVFLINSFPYCAVLGFFFFFLLLLFSLRFWGLHTKPMIYHLAPLPDTAASLSGRSFPILFSYRVLWKCLISVRFWPCQFMTFYYL
jgi:hypothetical protein